MSTVLDSGAGHRRFATATSATQVGKSYGKPKATGRAGARKADAAWMVGDSLAMLVTVIGHLAGAERRGELDKRGIGCVRETRYKWHI